jgi:hypothetical protein
MYGHTWNALQWHVKVLRLHDGYNGYDIFASILNVRKNITYWDITI